MRVYWEGKAAPVRVRDLIPGEVQRELSRRAELEDVKRLERRRLVRSDVDRLLSTMGLLG